VDLKRSIIFVHRWLGVGLCVLFGVWFASGIGMMYWDFPVVSAADRLDRSPPLDASTVRLAPEQALAGIDADRVPAGIRLNTFDGRPVYRFRIGREETLVYADTGERPGVPSRSQLDRIAAAWARQPIDTARAAEMTDIDQWTVQGPLRTLRPLWKYSWPNGDHVYVAGASGEVVQYTTTASRIGAYIGPIPHWLYFTPLRARQQTWSRVVIWTSGVGTIAAMLGIVIGVWMYSPAKRYRREGLPSHLPYRGQKRWHALLGLVFGLAAITWAFSGMLSMDPFPALADGRSDRNTVAQALRGRVRLSDFSTLGPSDALARLAGARVKELELAVVGGEPVYLASLDGGDMRIVPVRGEPRTAFTADAITTMVTRAAGQGTAVTVDTLDRYDRYYLDRRGRKPLPVLVARLKDTDETRYYIDPKTARIVGTYSARNWVSRWLYHGLHSLDFPWLYSHRPAWDIVVIAFMIGGAALSVTSITLAYRVLTTRAARSE